jgi:hypothetical protein
MSIIEFFGGLFSKTGPNYNRRERPPVPPVGGIIDKNSGRPAGAGEEQLGQEANPKSEPSSLYGPDGKKKAQPFKGENLDIEA